MRKRRRGGEKEKKTGEERVGKDDITLFINTDQAGEVIL